MNKKPMSAKDRNKLQKLSNEIRSKLWADDEVKAEAENASLLGRFFKARNNYSCPEKPSDYWPLYSAVVGVQGRNVSLVQFETDKYGDTMIRCGDRCGGVHALDEEITEDEFLKAAGKMQKSVAALILKAISK